MNDIPYLLRGVQPINSETSKLTSSSKYLNSAKLREWAAFILFRKNGSDFPPPAEMHGFSDMIAEQKDFGHIEQMFTEERKQNPKLEAWFTAGRSSHYVIEDFKRYEKNTVGGIFYRWITEGNYDIRFGPGQSPRVNWTSLICVQRRRTTWSTSSVAAASTSSASWSRTGCG